MANHHGMCPRLPAYKITRILAAAIIASRTKALNSIYGSYGSLVLENSLSHNDGDEYRAYYIGVISHNIRIMEKKMEATP